MRVVVVGAGVLGLTTGYFLQARGHEVTILESEDGPGLGTSFANGALLTPSMSAPWNSPGCWRILLNSLVRSDAPLQLHWREMPRMFRWGLQFLSNSQPELFRRNTLNNLRLALLSMKALDSLQKETGIVYGAQRTGTLRLFRDSAALRQAWEAARDLSAHGLDSHQLSGSEALAIEPSLAPVADQLAGVIHYEADQSGDAYRFCLELAASLRKRGVEVCYRTRAISLEVHSGVVNAVATDRGSVKADNYVVANGCLSVPMLKQIGVTLPIQPAKGYSVTFPDREIVPTLKIPIVDDDLHVVAVPLEGVIRVAGTAEFAGHDRGVSEARIRNLQQIAQRLLPEAKLDPITAKPWCGFRAMSVDGVPLIGMTSLNNLFVNTGHGHLGWTMATGSGRLLTELICGGTPSIDPAPYSLGRFGAH